MIYTCAPLQYCIVPQYISLWLYAVLNMTEYNSENKMIATEYNTYTCVSFIKMLSYVIPVLSIMFLSFWH